MVRKGTTRKSTRARPTRPELPRTEPIRSWSTLFGAGRSTPGAPNGAGASGDSVKRGVELGYRVIDEYIKQGTAVANAFATPGRARAPSAQDLPKMTERMMQYGSDFASIWFDAMALMMSNLNGAGVSGPSGPATTPPPAVYEGTPRSAAAQPAVVESQPSTRLALDLRSRQPTELLFTLDVPLTFGRVVVEDLRTRSGGPTIQGVIVELPDNPMAAIKVGLQVPTRTPPGRYSGAILDATTKNPRGRVTVIIAK
jgi:hypothetical protein